MPCISGSTMRSVLLAAATVLAATACTSSDAPESGDDEPLIDGGLEPDAQPGPEPDAQPGPEPDARPAPAAGRAPDAQPSPGAQPAPEPVASEGVYALASTLDLQAAAVLPQTVYDGVVLLRGLRDEPGRTLFDLAESAGVPYVEDF